MWVGEYNFEHLSILISIRRNIFFDSVINYIYMTFSAYNKNTCVSDLSYIV